MTATLRCNRCGRETTSPPPARPQPCVYRDQGNPEHFCPGTMLVVERPR